MGSPPAGADHLGKAGGLLLEHRFSTLGLCLHLGVERIRFTLGATADFFGLRLGLQFDFPLFDLGLHDDVGLERRLFLREAAASAACSAA